MLEFLFLLIILSSLNFCVCFNIHNLNIIMPIHNIEVNMFSIHVQENSSGGFSADSDGTQLVSG